MWGVIAIIIFLVTRTIYRWRSDNLEIWTKYKTLDRFSDTYYDTRGVQHYGTKGIPTVTHRDTKTRDLILYDADTHTPIRNYDAERRARDANVLPSLLTGQGYPYPLLPHRIYLTDQLSISKTSDLGLWYETPSYLPHIRYVYDPVSRSMCYARPHPGQKQPLLHKQYVLQWFLIDPHTGLIIRALARNYNEPWVLDYVKQYNDEQRNNVTLIRGIRPADVEDREHYCSLYEYLNIENDTPGDDFERDGDIWQKNKVVVKNN